MLPGLRPSDLGPGPAAPWLGPRPGLGGGRWPPADRGGTFWSGRPTGVDTGCTESGWGGLVLSPQVTRRTGPARMPGPVPSSGRVVTTLIFPPKGAGSP